MSFSNIIRIKMGKRCSTYHPRHGDGYDTYPELDNFLIKGRLGDRLVAYIYSTCEECHIRRDSLGYISHLA